MLKLHQLQGLQCRIRENAEQSLLHQHMNGHGEKSKDGRVQMVIHEIDAVHVTTIVEAPEEILSDANF